VSEISKMEKDKMESNLPTNMSTEMAETSSAKGSGHGRENQMSESAVEG
jgi:hypothetical protein